MFVKEGKCLGGRKVYDFGIVNLGSWWLELEVWCIKWVVKNKEYGNMDYGIWNVKMNYWLLMLSWKDVESEIWDVEIYGCCVV